MANSIGNQDFVEQDFTTKAKMMRRDDDTISEASMGSHRNHKLRSDADSHKGSELSFSDPDKKNASKDDLEEDGLYTFFY